MTLLFTYGTLRPDEFAYPQIADLVHSYEQAKLKSAEIYLRDGLAALKIHESNGYEHRKVNGFVITPKADQVEELFERVKNYEGSNYKQVSVLAELASGEIREVQTFAGAKIDQSNPEPWEGEWNTAHSPLLGYGLPALLISMRFEEPKVPDSLGPSGYWRENEYWLGKGKWPGLLRIEGAYLTLTSIFEYVLTLRYGRRFGQDVMKRIEAISREPEMLDAFKNLTIREEWNVRDVSNIGAGKASPTSLKRALDSCYTVRNNLTHRGKSVKSDAVRIIGATQLLSELLTNYLLNVMPELRNVWPIELTTK